MRIFTRERTGLLLIQCNHREKRRNWFPHCIYNEGTSCDSNDLFWFIYFAFICFFSLFLDLRALFGKKGAKDFIKFPLAQKINKGTTFIQKMTFIRFKFE